MMHAQILSGLVANIATITLASGGAPPADDGFAPGLFVLVLASIAACLVLIGVGIVIAIAGLACTAALVGLGIISTSAVIGLMKRRVSTAVLALYYQIFAAIAAPLGVLALWGWSALFHPDMRTKYIVLFGLISGIVAGLGMAFAIGRIARIAYSRFLLRLGRDSGIQPSA